MALNLTSETNFLGFYEDFSQRFVNVSGGEPEKAITKVNTGSLDAKQPIPGVAEYSPIVLSKFIDFGPDNSLINQIELDFVNSKPVRCVLQRVLMKNGVVTPDGYAFTYFDCIISKWEGPKASGDSSSPAMLTVTLNPSSRKLGFVNG